MMPIKHFSSMAVVLLGAAGCASTGIPEQREAVAVFAKAQGFGETPVLTNPMARAKADALVTQQLGLPLNQRDAVALALASSPAFQSLRATLEAESARSGARAQPPNPLFTFERLVRREGVERDLDIGRMLSTSLFAWLSLPARLEATEREQALQQTQAMLQLTQTVAAVRQAWVRAVAAQQAVIYFEQVRSAAEASAELARRMQVVGNFSKLQRAREHAFYADATAQQARAQHAALAAREALVRALGLTPEQAVLLKLPERLPDLPTAPRSAPEVTQVALAQRLDVKIASATLENLGASRTLTAVQSVAADSHLSGVRRSETGLASQRGFELELALPLFDWGTGARRELGARIRAAEHQATQTARAASSQLREAYSAYSTSYELAKHYRNEVVPLRKAIADEMLLKYNGMLIGVFDLLADARAQIGSVIQAIDAERDFWLADAALQSTLIGGASAAQTMEMTPSAMSGETKGH
jgi:outer membrane protein TolC